MAAVVLLAGCAGSRPAPTPVVSGYLAGADYAALSIAPGPTERSLEAAAFHDVQPGTDRWWLAISHAEARPPFAAQHFDCALGVRLNDRPRPALTRLMSRLLADADALTRRLSAEHPRPRPVVAITGLEPCQRADEPMRRSSSWPSAGAVAGAAYGELFAELAPDRSEAVRNIGDEIGRSRVICRMNWPADVADGKALGRSLYAAAARGQAFQDDVAAARAEITAARSEGLTNPGCAAERRALAQAGRGAASAP